MSGFQGPLITSDGIYVCRDCPLKGDGVVRNYSHERCTPETQGYCAKELNANQPQKENAANKPSQPERG